MATPLAAEPTGICWVKVFVPVLTRATLPDPVGTYSRDPSASRSMPHGLPPTGIVVTTALEAVSITLTSLEFRLATYTRWPFGLMVTR
jgi:hypothetical protein